MNQRVRALSSALRLREGRDPAQRALLDARTLVALARPLAIVYTDTADFTRSVVRHGILHFLMVPHGFARFTTQPMPIARLVPARAGARRS